MTHLLGQIKQINERAAWELEREGFTKDQDIRSLDRQDLLELLPGKDKLRVRKQIHELIRSSPPSNEKYSVDAILKNIRGLIPPDSLSNALSDNGPLEKYLSLLKGHRYQLMSVLEMIEAQIDLLERERGNPDAGKRNDVFNTNTVSTVYTVNTPSTNTGSWTSWLFPPQKRGNVPSAAANAPDSATGFQSKINTSLRTKPQIATVMYKMVVCGKTLDKHLDIIEKLKGPVPGHNINLQLQEVTDLNYQVILLFCPVVSRAGTDVEAALREISSHKPLILVVMHHMHSPTSVAGPKNKI
ncbi:hypothetical protein NQD34_017966 [Periophthalmus magnuspinnatus]|nr:hypothetical protein NQD34_017966 [Periophthalmus magnuspinnatus]